MPSLFDTWRPTTSFSPSDQIISSQARLIGDVYGFTPTYLNEPVNMFALLSEEYRKRWFVEQGRNQKNGKAKKVQMEIKKEWRPFYKRRFVVRDMVALRNRASSSPPIVRSKQFEKIKKKVNTFRTDEDKANWNAIEAGC